MTFLHETNTSKNDFRSPGAVILSAKSFDFKQSRKGMQNNNISAVLKTSALRILKKDVWDQSLCTYPVWETVEKSD